LKYETIEDILKIILKDIDSGCLDLSNAGEFHLYLIIKLFLSYSLAIKKHSPAFTWNTGLFLFSEAPPLGLEPRTP
jgi:hypothetical protein